MFHRGGGLGYFALRRLTAYRMTWYATNISENLDRLFIRTVSGVHGQAAFFFEWSGKLMLR